MLRDEDRVPQGPGPLMDYVLEPYAPRASLQGRLHSVSVLRWWLRERGWLEHTWPVVERLRELLGPGQTVWGVKDPPSVEFYFYNHGDLERMSVERLREGLSDLVSVDSRVRPGQRYLMCSLELVDGASDGFRVYVAGGPSEQSADGTSYLVRGEALELENLYWFDPPSRLDRTLGHLKRSVRTAGRIRPLLPREYLDCHTVCYATKRHADALYFSRLGTPTTTLWLRRHWPALAPLFEAHAEDLAHLRWDVGYDFTEGRPRKTGLYGFA